MSRKTESVRNNPVAKNAGRFNRATAYRDRTKYDRKRGWRLD